MASKGEKPKGNEKRGLGLNFQEKGTNPEETGIEEGNWKPMVKNEKGAGDRNPFHISFGFAIRRERRRGELH